MKKKLALLLWGIGLALLGSCTSDTMDPREEESSVILELSTFTNTGSDFVLMNLSTEETDPVAISLRETFDLEFFENARFQFDPETLAFYTWENQRSRVYYNDLTNGTPSTEIDICGFESESDVPKFIQGIWGSNSYWVMAYAESPNGVDLVQRIRISDRSGGPCRDLTIEDTNLRGIRDMQLQGDLLLLLYEELGTDLPVIRLVDPAQGTNIITLNLDEDFQAATLNESELLLFGSDQTVQTFAIQSLTFTTESSLPDFPLLRPGLFKTRFSGDNILVSVDYQQPSLFFAQPSVYNLRAGGFSAGGEDFLPILQSQIEADTGDRFLFGVFDADPESGRIAIAYIKGDGSPEGGLVISDFDGNPLQIIPLPFLPDDVVIRSVQYR